LLQAASSADPVVPAAVRINAGTDDKVLIDQIAIALEA
jgi:hypothetical protein